MKKIILIIGLLFSMVAAKDIDPKELETNCNNGDMKACSSLGNLYDKGKGVEQNYQKAFQLYQKACDGEYLEGCINLGVLYYKGNGVEQNYQIAAQLCQKACDGGNSEMCRGRAVSGTI